jgi:hypothetical protein
MPEASVVIVWLTPVEALVMVTLTPGRRAWDWSVTVPRISPLCLLWPAAGLKNEEINKANTGAKRNFDPEGDAITDSFCTNHADLGNFSCKKDFNNKNVPGYIRSAIEHAVKLRSLSFNLFLLFRWWRQVRNR